MAFLSHFLILLWKNLVLQKRKICLTVFEILLPLIFMTLLILVRHIGSIKLVASQNGSTLFNRDRTDLQFLRTARIVYTPNDATMSSMMQALDNTTFVNGFMDEESMLEYASEFWHLYPYQSGPFGLVVQDDFEKNVSGFSQKMQVIIRPSSEDYYRAWITQFNFNFYGATGLAHYPASYTSFVRVSFVDVQHDIGRSMIEYIDHGSATELDNVKIRLRQMPIPSHQDDSVLSRLRFILPAMLVISFLLNNLQVTKNVVHEKQSKLKEMMKMMGLTDLEHWCAWFAKCFLFQFISIIVITLLLLIAYPLATRGELPEKVLSKARVLAQSDMFIVFLFLLCYSVASITFCFFISTLFKKANVAAGACAILYILLYVPYNALVTFYPYLNYSQKMASCLLSNTAVGLGFNVILMHEEQGDGLQWSNIAEPAVYDDDFSMADVFIMLIVDICIHLFLTWYIDAVYPGEFGTPQPWYFPVKPSYWCGTKPQKYAKSISRAEEGRDEFFEAEPRDLPLGISIKNMKKVFRKGGRKHIAVAGVNLNMYEGQITALLGHNGAGKTTTIHMLTGFLTTTDGTAVVNGYDIHEDMMNVRKNLGFCHQHSVLFETLTVKEHLIFCAKLKGTPSSRMETEVHSTLETIRMLHKKDTFAGNLSGGEKRRLSVAMALVGDTKVVILDEPTSGMDPEARRNLWSILNQAKVGRTILLTTHYMEEADILGDRIAIMAEGVVKCCGSSLFLKNKYGSGYHLTMVKGNTGQGLPCDTSIVTQTIKSHIPTAHLDSDVAAELTYKLPHNTSPMFHGLFRELEQHGAKIGITGFGVSVTTLEEVFLRVGEGASDDPEMWRLLKQQHSTEDKISGDQSKTLGRENLGYDGELSDDVQSNCHGDIQMQTFNTQNHEHAIDVDIHQGLMKSSGIRLLSQQFLGILMKNMLYTWRNRMTVLIQLLVPVVFTILALLIDAASTSSGRNRERSEPSKVLDMSPFRENHVVYHVDKNASDNLKGIVRAYESLFTGSASKLEQIDGDIDDYLKDVGEKLGRAQFDRTYLLGTSFEQNYSELTITMHHNKDALHMPGVAMTYAINTLTKFILGSEYNIEMFNHPMPWQPREMRTSVPLRQSIATAFIIAFMLLFALSVMSTTFVTTLISERSTGAKQIQFVSGCRPLSYWIPCFIWDLLFFLLPIFGMLIVFAAFQSDAYSQEGRLGVVFVILLLYAWSILPFLYVGQFPFRTPAGGTLALTLLNLLSGMVTLLIVVMLQSMPRTVDIANGLKSLFSIFLPNYCLGQAFINLIVNYAAQKTCESMSEVARSEICRSDCSATVSSSSSFKCLQVQDSFFAVTEPGIGRYILFMFFHGVIYFIIIFVIEYRLIKRLFYYVSELFPRQRDVVPSVISPSTPEDSDVAEENTRVLSQSEQLRSSESLVLTGFSKQYGNLLAVDHLNLGVSGGQCFGLLGVNGAGKTSTFKMLTGQEMVSDGNAYLNGYDVKQDMTQVHQSLGYCPQDDVLMDQLTGREHLTLISRLRGVKESMLKMYVNKTLTALHLDEHADKRTSAYSGGNKRKLTTAIALIGDSPLLFLDEPTTGVDPAARRQLWNVLSGLRDKNRTLILTSHSMEECDALCTRLAIMVNGRFLCLGSPQYLKNKFGKGYTLLARVGTDDNGTLLVQPFKEFLSEKYPDNCRLTVEENYVTFQIMDSSILLSDIFGTLEGCLEQFQIEDYSVNQTTLQEVFIDFAKMQNAPHPPAKSRFCGCSCYCKP